MQQENFMQPILENASVKLSPLKAEDFDKLFTVASDPEIWKQHPNPDRFKKDVFQKFFEGAMASEGAFLITDRISGEVAGSTRFYSFDEEESSIFIGYTFYGTKFWGSRLNPQVKKLMLDYIFNYVEFVKFHVGMENLRSRKAMERLGAELKGEVMIAYFGEGEKQNVEYWIRKNDWLKR